MQIESQVARWLAIVSDASATPGQRIDAARSMVVRGCFAEVEHDLGALSEVESIATEARRLHAIVKQLKRWNIAGSVEHYTSPGITFDADSSVLVARRVGATKTILVFTGRAQQFWISIHLLHQMLPGDCHLVYLRDPRFIGHVFGLEALGDDYLATAEGLRTLCSDLGPTDVYCIGNSQGGYAAMRYGLDLAVRRVLAFVPATDGSVLRTEGWLALVRKALEDRRMSDEALLARLPPDGLDLAALYRERPMAPPAKIVFGGDCLRDVEEARRMAGLPHVILEELPGYPSHDVVAELIATGRFRPLIDELLA